MTEQSDREVWQPGEKVIARYNFAGSTADDLPFRRWETLTVVTATRDPNWYRAKNAADRCGMIPANYVTKRSAVKPNAMPWFHGKISREEAERLLAPREDGLFLVRDSTNFPGDYTLCVCCDGRVEHYHVSCTSQGQLTIDSEVVFDCLHKLIEHYELAADGLCSRLFRSVPKQGSHDYSVDPGAFEVAGWRIRREDIKLGEQIGRGEFGEVHLASYREQRVAVKTLRDCSRSVQQLLTEASVMTALRHDNLVQLIGVVIDTGVVHQVLEYMSQGSLVELLRNRGRSMLNKHLLIGYACDTCAGMAYLESRHVVHRDLAARNVLVSEEGVAKVSDFGLARGEQFCQQGGKIPIKWTAPEAIQDHVFSNKSDMWSFGVLLWEIYAFGRVPYPRISRDDVLQHLRRGNRMEAPDGCPSEIYSLMREAWHDDPEYRPSFRQAAEQLEKFRSSLTTTITTP